MEKITGERSLCLVEGSSRGVGWGIGGGSVPRRQSALVRSWLEIVSYVSAAFEWTRHDLFRSASPAFILFSAE